jgi:hypothetical protein
MESFHMLRTSITDPQQYYATLLCLNIPTVTGFFIYLISNQNLQLSYKLMC